MGITEESTHGRRWKRQNLFLEIPSRTSQESSSQDFVAIKMPQTPSPSPTPKRVNFLMTSRSVDAPVNNKSPGPSASKGRPSIRSLFPKLSFRYLTSLDVEKASSAAAESSSSGPREKPSISRTLSLTKIFTPRIKRTSSLPADEITHSNSESAHVGSVGASLQVMFWSVLN